MKNTTETSALSLLANDAGYDPLEDRLRENIRSTIEAVFEEELAQFLGRCRYGREDALRQGYRNGHRERQLTGTFGTERVSVPRARIVEEDGRASEWRSRALPRYQRLTRKAEALIASVYLSGTNTRRVKRALFGLFRTASQKRATSSLPSRACPRANGNQPERPTPLSVSTRSSSAGSKHRPCCRVPKQCRCSSGRSSLPAKSRCAKSMDGKPSIS